MKTYIKTDPSIFGKSYWLKYYRNVNIWNNQVSSPIVLEAIKPRGKCVYLNSYYEITNVIQKMDYLRIQFIFILICKA